MDTKFAILGAGHGGMAMAAHLAHMGKEVSLYNRSEERIYPIKAAGGIDLITDGLEDMPHGFVKIENVSADIAKAIDGAKVLMVVVPATGHKFMAEALAPHLKDGQIIVLNPGRTCGALEVHNILKEKKCKADVIIAEAQTFIYASRMLNPGQARIFRVKNNIPVAALPAHATPTVVKALRTAFVQFVPGDNIMKTSLDNIGAIFHPAVTVLNGARIESTNGDFDYYTEGITPTISLILEKMDKERVSVAEALGFRAMSAREWLYVAYDAAGRTLYEAMRANRGYDGIKAPRTMFTRYISEDVPCSLVPIASLGDMVGVECPTIKSIIHLASICHDVDYWAEGRTVEKLGIKDMSLKNLRHLILEGDIHDEAEI